MTKATQTETNEDFDQLLGSINNSKDLAEIFNHDPKQFLDTTTEVAHPTYTVSHEAMAIPQTRSILFLLALPNYEGKIEFHMMCPLNLHNPRLSKNFRDRTVYVASQTDSEEEQTSKDQTVYNNSNPAMMGWFLKPSIGKDKNPFNCLLVQAAYMREAVVPAEITITSGQLAEINAPTLSLNQAILYSNNLQDETAKQDFVKGAYKLYLDQINGLIERGLLVKAQILVALPSSLKPIHTISSSSDSTTNAFLNAKNILNGKTKTTRIPMLNRVFGAATLSNDDEFPNSTIKLGIKDVNKETGVQSNWKVANVYSPNVGRPLPIVVSVIDKNYKEKGKKTKTENLEEAASRGATVFFTGELRPHVMQEGTQGKLNGHNLFAVELTTYWQFNNATTRKSIEFDELQNLGGNNEVMLDPNGMNVLNMFELPTTETKTENQGSKDPDNTETMSANNTANDII